jgi:hypothetical protein
MDNEEHLRRWRLILGGDEADGIGIVPPATTAAPAIRRWIGIASGE